MARLLEGEHHAEVCDLVELGLHHEQQHQELLLMDIKHVLSCNVLEPAYAAWETSPRFFALRCGARLSVRLVRT